MNSSKNALHSRRFRYGGVALILTCVLIAAVILFNALFTFLAQKLLWYTDMTTESLYTLSDAAISALKDVDSKGQDVKIIFCDEPDNLDSDTTQRLVYRSALEIAQKVDYVKIEHINIYRNPTAVNQYKTTSKSTINSQSVIIACGTEFRVYTLRAFYMFEETDTSTPVAYNGEKKLVSGILAVTQAESPIACVTVNHGEPFTTDAERASSAALLSMLQDAGYIVSAIDLSNQEIPEDCRMLFIYNPSDDFLVKEEGISDKSEIEKIDRFLDGNNAMAVFMDPATTRLPHLEEYLEEWGISFMREENVSGKLESCVVQDNAHSLTTDGMTIIGAYTSGGLGASIHKDLRTQFPPKVIFKDAMPIKYADGYQLTEYVNEDDKTDRFTYGSFYRDGASRDIYDVFVSYADAKAMAGGREIGTATEADPYKLMTVSRETRMVTNTDPDYSYVLACGSTGFLGTKMLQSNVYGNTDVMLSAMRAMGKEFVPVGLESKTFVSTKIESLTTAEANRFTVLLTVLPPVAVFGVGIVVLVRRKYA